MPNLSFNPLVKRFPATTSFKLIAKNAFSVHKQKRGEAKVRPALKRSKKLKQDNQLTVTTLRESLESLGAGEMTDVAIAVYIIKKFKEIAEKNSKDEAIAELSDLNRELKADAKTAELAKIIDWILLGMQLSKS